MTPEPQAENRGAGGRDPWILAVDRSKLDADILAVADNTEHWEHNYPIAMLAGMCQKARVERDDERTFRRELVEKFSAEHAALVEKAAAEKKLVVGQLTELAEADLAALRAERDALMRAGVRVLNAPYSGEASADLEYGAARNEMRLALGFDAGNPEQNHYDWYWPSYIPRPLTAEWLTEIREAMVAARTDPFCDDAAQVMLVLIDSLLALDSEKWTLVDERNDLYRRMQEQAHRAEIAEGRLGENRHD